MNKVNRLAALCAATALAVAIAVGAAPSGHAGGHRASVMADHGWGPAAVVGATQGV